MGVLANYLHQIWRTTVLDHTGIAGKFDFVLDLDRVAAELSSQTAPGQYSFGDYVRDAVERLGFRMEPQKVTVPITVIDHVERPSEN